MANASSRRESGRTRTIELDEAICNGVEHRAKSLGVSMEEYIVQAVFERLFIKDQEEGLVEVRRPPF